MRRSMLPSLRIALLHVAMVSFAQSPAPFAATPLTDFKLGETYLGTFPGLLYTGSNNPPADHDADGRKFASQIKPGPNGRIVVIGIGMSSWTDELCIGGPNAMQTNCLPNSFITRAQADPSVNNPVLALVDCAQGGHDAKTWIDDSFGSYSTCDSRLLNLGLSPSDVQVILWKDGDERPTVSLSSNTVCNSQSQVDACIYLGYLGPMARFSRMRYRNTKQLFLHSRIYAGYATTNLNPEPFAYEYAFATRMFIEAQISQVRTGQIDPLTGDLSYSVAPWLAWGPYFWASGTTPRNDGLAWLPADYQSDKTHPGLGGVTKVADLMINWYLSSPYTPWFRKSGL